MEGSGAATPKPKRSPARARPPSRTVISRQNRGSSSGKSTRRMGQKVAQSGGRGRWAGGGGGRQARGGQRTAHGPGGRPGVAGRPGHMPRPGCDARRWAPGLTQEVELPVEAGELAARDQEESVPFDQAVLQWEGPTARQGPAVGHGAGTMQETAGSRQRRGGDAGVQAGRHRRRVKHPAQVPPRPGCHPPHPGAPCRCSAPAAGASAGSAAAGRSRRGATE